MTAAHFSFEGLDPIESEIHRLGNDAAYLVLQDRTDRAKDETVGRFDFDDASAAPFEPELDDEGECDPENESLADGADRLAVITAAACAWMRQTAQRNTTGESMRRFRVRVYGPKGHYLLFSGQFVCRHDDVDELPAAPIPQPNFDQATSLASVKAIKALGDGYSHFAQLLVGAMSQLQGLNNAVLSRSHRQAEESREQVDKLVATMVEYRWREAEQAAERADSTLSDARRTELVKEGLEQLGKIANAMLVQKGIAPELVDVVQAIGNSPDLMSALQDPSVRDLMRNPHHLADLARLLRHAAATAQPNCPVPLNQHAARAVHPVV